MRCVMKFLFVALLLAGLISVFSVSAASAKIEDVPWQTYTPKADRTTRPSQNIRVDPHPDGIKMWLKAPT